MVERTKLNPSGQDVKNGGTMLVTKLYDKPKVQGNIGDWQGRHLQAVCSPRGFERPLVRMVEQWLRYADAHQKEHESPIGEDFVLGQYWEDIGDALRGLLNGQSGRLDCGTLDAVILDSMQAVGIDVSSK
jgi:hypothetical protein